MKKLFKKVYEYLFAWKVKRLIIQADQLSKSTGYKYMVLNFRGIPKLIRKCDAKQLLKQKIFNVRSIQELEQKALYVSTSRKF